MVDKLLVGQIAAPVREDMSPAKVDGDGRSLPIDAKSTLIDKRIWEGCGEGGPSG